MRTTISINDNLLTEAKLLAAQTGRTLTAVIEDALRESFARRNKTSIRKPLKLPSFGSGGLQPGVDINDSAALWELMDEDNVTR